jgi:hypothetical protein
MSDESGQLLSRQAFTKEIRDSFDFSPQILPLKKRG